VTAVDRAACEQRDAADPLGPMRARFALPPGVVYLDGNSLGALPRTTPALVAAAVAEQWGQGLVRSWTDAHWMEAPLRVGNKIARLIGADRDEVIVADSTSVCLFKVICAALAMRPGRGLLLTEEENFHTDLYVAAGAARLRCLGSGCSIRSAMVSARSCSPTWTTAPASCMTWQR
jgi:kynureninase